MNYRLYSYILEVMKATNKLEVYFSNLLRYTTMIHETIQSFLDSAVKYTVNDISKYTVHPDADLLRTKKLPADKLLSFLISQASSITKNERLDFYSMDANAFYDLERHTYTIPSYSLFTRKMKAKHFVTWTW